MLHKTTFEKFSTMENTIKRLAFVPTDSVYIGYKSLKRPKLFLGPISII